MFLRSPQENRQTDKLVFRSTFITVEGSAMTTSNVYLAIDFTCDKYGYPLVLLTGTTRFLQDRIEQQLLQNADFLR